MADPSVTFRIVKEFSQGGTAGGGLAGAASSGGGGAGGSLGGAASTIAGSMGKMLVRLGVITGALFGIKKVLEKIAEASPRLQATMEIFKKAMMVPMRILGDSMSLFLRPLAISLLKFLIPILKKFNIMMGTEEGKEKAELLGGVAAGGIAGAGIGATIGGIVGGVGGAAIGGAAGAVVGGAAGAIPKAIEGVENIGIIITAWADEFMKIFGVDMDKVREDIAVFMLQTIPEFFTKTLPETFAQMITDFQASWSILTEWVSDNVVLPIQEAWGTIVDWIGKNVIEPFQEKWTQVSIWVDKQVIQPIKNSWTTMLDWFNTNIIDPIKEAWEGLTSWFNDKVITPIQDAFVAMVNFFIDKVNSIIPGERFDIPSLQTGGRIAEDGLFKLHKGEVVVPAQQAANTFSPNITVNANVSSDFDLQKLADDLARLTYDGIRRRTSYKF